MKKHRNMRRNGRSKLQVILLAAACAMSCSAQKPADAAAPADAPLDTFNYIAGTQVIGGDYQFTKEPLLIEGSKQILATGANMIKFSLSPSYAKNGYISSRDPSIHSLTDLAKTSQVRQVFAMPFSRYILWTYAFSTTGKLAPFHGHVDSAVLAKEYREIYDLTAYLLTTYSGTGKTFYLGNWEGDWALLAGSPEKPQHWEQVTNPDAPPGMIDWMQTRQKAVDDAKRATPYSNVQVWFYIECNLVQKSIKQNQISVASSVLGAVNPDFVSYSSYDSTNPDKDLHHDLPAALDYMQSKLKPKPGLPAKRVFVGEYGSHAVDFNPQQQDARMREVIATAIQWGTPFVLYWQLYGNANKGQPPAGNWLINDKGVKLPVYNTYTQYYADARGYVAQFEKLHQRKPTDAEFQAYAYKWFAGSATAIK